MISTVAYSLLLKLLIPCKLQIGSEEINRIVLVYTQPPIKNFTNIIIKETT